MRTMTGMRGTLVAIAFESLTLVVACTNSTPQPDAATGTAKLGAPCVVASDCESGICTAIGNQAAVCSKPCVSAADCTPGWHCSPLFGQSGSVCECAASSEVCDGKDNDCNGTIDDEPATDGVCTDLHGTGSVCKSGSCTCTLTSCGDRCVDSANDARNCGKCDVWCATGASCVSGACQCPGSQVACDGTCVDTQTNVLHCNGCNNACTLQGGVCSAGACECPTSKAQCGNACVDLATDNANCGACNVACGGTCVAGRCQINLATSTTTSEIVLDSSYVYWMKSNQSLARVAKSGGSVNTLYSASGSLFGVALNSADVFFVDGQALVSEPKNGGPATQLASSAGSSMMMADANFIYYLDANAGPKAVPVTGGTPTALANSVSGNSYGAFAIDSANAYWFDSQIGVIRKVVLSGGNPVTLATVQGVSALCTDGVNIYWAATGAVTDGGLPWTISSEPIGGGKIVQLASGTGTNIYSMTTDGASVYWADSATKVISKVATVGGSITQLAPNLWGGIAVDSSSVYVGTLTSLVKVTPK